MRCGPQPIPKSKEHPIPNFVYAGFNVTGNPSELKRFADLMFRPVTILMTIEGVDAAVVAATAMGFGISGTLSLIIVSDETATISAHDEHHMLHCDFASSTFNVVAGIGNGFSIGIFAAPSIACARRSVARSAAVDAGDRAATSVAKIMLYIAANPAAEITIEQRVRFIFYRMCAVYRAEGGFASRRSLNPVRPWP